MRGHVKGKAIMLKRLCYNKVTAAAPDITPTLNKIKRLGIMENHQAQIEDI
jgi:hypothetical protein